MTRYICIHGHFYQPPRENPWLEEVEVQDSASPYHDWNKRVTDECYAPNTASRILDEKKRIIDIVNNYAGISFNLGPTLLSWMARHEPEVYRSILEADRKGMKRFAGHGPALAQAYSHMIMPLANTRDKRTQVIWGIRDFESRFGRFPEGMWLPETAVDLETLDIMAAEGIKFTILAPHQATAVRHEDEGGWQDLEEGEIDVERPYLCSLPSGRSITIFFYHGPISHGVAFKDLLASGEKFKGKLLDAFSTRDHGPRLVHIATDGETYGHHHRYGEMALSFCLSLIGKEHKVDTTVYGKYLEENPPDWRVLVKEGTSWSCDHGLDRWKCDCGCNTGAHKGWHQKWREPLREAMDWLRDYLIDIYEKRAGEYLTDPWGARDAYISIILDRSRDNIESFLKAHSVRELSDEEKIKTLKLLEMQRHAMLMYTSCGWFFDDISGIETIQVIQYAARAIQMAKAVTGEDLERGYLDILKKGPSNRPGHIPLKAMFTKGRKQVSTSLSRGRSGYARI
jgi:alpha-amylase/alpha-mannosidase (GH57 family)